MKLQGTNRDIIMRQIVGLSVCCLHICSTNVRVALVTATHFCHKSIYDGDYLLREMRGVVDVRSNYDFKSSTAPRRLDIITF